jgi:anaerobic magnesium-protoporphyrin IX monomethyl ester cyclase
MKIALIAQDIEKDTYFKEMAVPIGLCYLASYGEHHFGSPLSFRILAGDEPFSPSDFDLIGISTMSYHFPKAIALAEKIKEQSTIPLLLGGPHITALPRTLPPTFDAAVIGEGEETFLELLKLFSEEGKFTPGALASIDGIAYRDQGEIIVNRLRPLIKDMRSIPFPRRDLWDLKGKMKQLFSGRGCPCRCHFCALPDTHYRKFPLDYILDELEVLRNDYGTGAAIFQDEAFAMKKTWLHELLGAMKKRHLHRDMSYFISMRADYIDEETADLFREMNVKCVFIGIESGSEKVLKYLKNSTVTVKDVQKALDLLAARDIQAEGSFILGSPGEGHREIQETYEFITRNYIEGKLDLVNIFCLLPFPGSGLWKEAESRGLVSDSMDWSHLASMPILQFNPESYIWLNQAMAFQDFLTYVPVFQELMVRIFQKGIHRLRENLFEPMGVEDYYKSETP